MRFGMALLIKNYYMSFSGLNRSCWQGIVLSFLESVLAGAFYFLSVYFVDILHIDISTSGKMISFYGLGTILGGYVGGRLSDRLSPTIVATISLFIQGITFLALIKVRQVEIIAVDLFVLGIATYTFITSNYVCVLSFCEGSESNRLKAINILSVASNLGIGFSSILIGELAYFGFQYVFFISGILLFLLAILASNFKVRIITDDKSKKKEQNDQAKNTQLSYKAAINYALLSLFFTGMIVSQLSTTYSIYVKEAFPNLGIHAYAILFSLNTILVICFQNYLVNKFSDKNIIIMIGVGSFLIGLGMFVLNFSFIFLIALFSCIIYSVGEMIFFSMVQLVCYQKSKEGKKGSGLGMYRMVYASSRFFGPTVGSSIYYYLGGNVIWYSSGFIGLALLILCNKYKKYA